MTNLENQLQGPDYSGFGLPFSADGETKNAIVLRSVDPNGQSGIEYLYFVRSRYANSTEMINVAGVPTLRPYIANYAFVRTDSQENILYVRNGIEAPDTDSYKIFNHESSIYDTDGKNKQVQEDYKKESVRCNGGSMRVCAGTYTSSANGEYLFTRRYGVGRTILNNYTIGANGWSFGQVRLGNYMGGDSAQLRIRAKGVGEVFRTYGYPDGYRERTAIYYQVNGETRGSLAGTPFDVGQPLEGLFF